MRGNYLSGLEDKIPSDHLEKLLSISDVEVHKFIAEYIRLCNPDSVYICDNSPEDEEYLREIALKNNEEAKLAIPGHTVHFDGYYDQARDKERTKILLSKGMRLGSEFNTMERREGIKEIRSLLKDIMIGRQMLIKFYCLGPLNSVFSIPCVQITDSAYVAHSESLLYRNGYSMFKEGRFHDSRFFKFVHSQGELEPNGLGLLVSKNVDKRRIYIDLKEEIIYSVNTQYGGNTIGLKKLAMRLAIKRAVKEGWLTEHMFIMGVRGPNGRVSYFTGAYPSMCGKTSTAMIPGELIVGDDIAYIREINGEARAVNVEKGMFGIITGINSKDDPILWKILHSPNEI
ncbi:MAG: phosphoenolpyruvate carboxykinase domain-containing protein, partial [Candidatus Odinarchaeia archaeon]